MAYARLTTFPPLNELTVIYAEQTHIVFTVHVRWSHVRPKYPIEVVLCYTASGVSEHESKWATVPLTEVDGPGNIGQEDVHIACFATTLPRALLEPNHLIHVTYKYRVGPISPWLWIGTQQGALPSRLLLQRSLIESGQGLSEFLVLSPGWSAVKLTKTEDSQLLFRVESAASIPRPAEDKQDGALSDHVLGRSKDQVQFMALIRLEPYWLGARQGGDYFHLSEDAILCCFLVASGQVITVLTTSGIDHLYSVIRSNSDGDVVIAARCDADKEVPFQCFIGVAATIEESISVVMDAARETVNRQPQYRQLARDSISAGVSRASLESWYDGLTFCTWNALGQDLSQSKILDALSSLADNNIRISTLLIDDNWQMLGPVPGHDYSDSFNRGLWDLPANPAVAPEGLQSLTSKIRSLHPHVADIGVWHALLGYWGGISPTGKIAEKYHTVDVPSYLMGNIPTDITSISPTDLQRFYDDLYTYLSDSGITFVKTDVQHMLSTFRSSESRRTLVPAYQSAWINSCARHFGGKAISCMSQVPEILFSSLLQSYSPRVMARNSDDFYPEVAPSHPWHIWTNAHNTLLTQHLNVLPDWDMFQTSHAYSFYHAAARCISGGPITITDTPGLHDKRLLQQITALDSSGRSIALRPNVAKVIGGFEEYTRGNVLKIGTTTNAGHSLLGLWNIAEKDTSTLVPLSDFPSIREVGAEVIVYNYRTKQVFGPFGTRTTSRKTGTAITHLIFAELEARGWEIMTALPLYTFQIGSQSASIAILGLTDKMSGAAAVIRMFELSASEGVIELYLELKAVGVLGLRLFTPFESSPALRVELAGQKHGTMSGKNIDCKRITDTHSAVKNYAWSLTADLETEWHDQNLFSSENATIELKIRVSVVS